MLINFERVKDYSAEELKFCAKSFVSEFHNIKEYIGCDITNKPCSKCHLVRVCEDIFDSYSVIREEMERRRIDFSD